MTKESDDEDALCRTALCFAQMKGTLVADEIVDRTKKDTARTELRILEIATSAPKQWMK
jgi:hypothetical protein